MSNLRNIFLLQNKKEFLCFLLYYCNAFKLACVAHLEITLTCMLKVKGPLEFLLMKIC